MSFKTFSMLVVIAWSVMAYWYIFTQSDSVFESLVIVALSWLVVDIEATR